MDSVYIETSIVSYATAWPSRDIQTAAMQQQARDWWSLERPKFDLVTSQLVINEASAGDPTAASDRLKLLDGLDLVDVGADAQALANRILAAHLMPQKAAADALHVAAAALGGVNYLLTLNCKHIANAHELPRVYRLLDSEGLGQLLICTPAEFLGGDDDEESDT
ncbi:type II toxin-antitoxin system VapC family toxin [Stieleria sp. ICT_E10.1]|uniref:type II toxin-antitoxin system VapC family toxin n=1 Tax=Stieleria sedimenti TaxID=2976331 RepID=UPI0021804DE6|nr:type II toxin-antitoxin system VapC family toxin [Stieleria sedimenti]MCS7471712.1 type II toxin-antitoxin system VapC family toxin [Stieleria sedimenti]